MAEIHEYLKDILVLVDYNAAFDIGCIRHTLELYGMEKPEITYYVPSVQPANPITSDAMARTTFNTTAFTDIPPLSPCRSKAKPRQVTHKARRETLND